METVDDLHVHRLIPLAIRRQTEAATMATA